VGTIGRQALERPAYHATRPPTLRRTRRGRAGERRV